MNTRTQTSVFAPAEGALREYHVLAEVTDPSLCYEKQLETILKAYAESAEGRTVHFRRFFLSDAANQNSLLQQALRSLPPVPTSVVQQAPLDGTRIALWLYATDPTHRPDGIPTHNGYAHHWAASLTSPGTDSYRQMTGIFRSLEGRLAGKGLSIARDTIRTWIFARDVDVDYSGVVDGRKDYFDGIGLTVKTHYIARSGIEGKAPEPHDIVAMDAYSVSGLQEGQQCYLHAKDHLNRTSDYGVTFERGTSVTYGDRKHVFISGTASIDAAGNVLYPGDAAAQTRRMLANVRALLSEAGANFGDVTMAIVYLRDPADFPVVRAVIGQSGLPLSPVFVHAPVCRPAWLVEMECIAVTDKGDKTYPDF